MNKIVTLFVVGFFIISGFSTIAKSNGVENISVMYDKIFLSKPIFTKLDRYINIIINESEIFHCQPGKPLLPVITKTYTFPLGTKIFDVDVTCQYKEFILSKKVQPAPTSTFISNAFKTFPVVF